MFRAVACSCLKGQRGRILYGGIPAQKRRYLPLPTICCSQSNSVVLIFSLGLFSYSHSPYPHIIVQLLWLRERLFEQKPKSPPLPVSPTRDFCIALFYANGHNLGVVSVAFKLNLSIQFQTIHPVLRVSQYGAQKRVST